VIQVDAEAAREMAAAAPARKACWWASAAAPRWRPSRRSCPSCRPAARVLGFNYDTGERYLSVEGYLPA
jgi:cysteine synthase A